MASSFRDLQRSREKMFETLNKEVEKTASGGRPAADERIWYPTRDKAGNGYAVIRFLPAAQGETVPYVREFSHGFKGPGGYYIEKSLSTLGQPDPLGEFNQSEWARGEAAGETSKKPGPILTKVKQRKRNLSYYANIYIVKDPANPENEGKVKLYRFGAKIFAKIKDAMNPPASYEETAPFNPFDLWGGANFKLRIKTIEMGDSKFPNYDDSSFDTPAPLFDDDKKLEAIWKEEHSLQALIAPDTFKTYDELKARLDRVLGHTAKQMEDVQSAPAREERSAPARQQKVDLPWEDTELTGNNSGSTGGDGDEDLEYFKRLAEQQ